MLYFAAKIFTVVKISNVLVTLPKPCYNIFSSRLYSCIWLYETFKPAGPDDKQPMQVLTMELLSTEDSVIKLVI